MSTTLTVSAGTLMLAVPGLIALGGAVVGVALRGDLATRIEVARLNAAYDGRTARWLFLRGYRKTPNAGPDVTAEPEVLALSDRSHADEQADHTDTDRPHWWATVVAFVVLAPVAFARRQLPVLVEYLRDRFKNDEERDAEFRQSIEDRFERFRIDDSPRGRSDADDPDISGQWAMDAAIVDAPDTAEPVQIVRVNRRYRDPGMTGQFPYVKVAGVARHAAPEPEMPAINSAVPTQRTGDADA